MLQNKHLLLGITGSISAYKALELTRLLVKEGAEVKVLMTKAAQAFVGPLSFSTLSKNPVLSEYYEETTGEWNNHVDLGLWADLMVIAPASANTLSKMAQGACDNLLLATYLSARCPILACPAMDLDMYAHPSTQRNLQQLREDGLHLMEPGSGALASGLKGKGRLPEPLEILTEIKNLLSAGDPKLSFWKGKKVMITAGPTREYLDPVRFISNPSTGTMGYALAEWLQQGGAEVHLISGPVQLQPPKDTHFHAVETAQEMLQQARKLHPAMDMVLFTAAVGDYAPKSPASEKIKKDSESLTIELHRNPDIALELGKQKKAGQYHLGFALETSKELQLGIDKMQKKHFDALVFNTLANKGAGFGTKTNQITIIDREQNTQAFPLKDKKSTAKTIVDFLYDELQH